MGVHVAAYAIDTAAFSRLIESSLASILAKLRWANREREILFSVYDGETHQRYHALPDRSGVWRIGGGNHEELSDDELVGNIFLTQSVRTYLHSRSSIDLKMFIDVIPLLLENACETISIFHKRWWMGSALVAASDPAALSPREYAELARLFAKILRVYQCGVPLQKHNEMPPVGSFPIIPLDDVDCRMAVFDETDARRLGHLCGNLSTSRLRFRLPPNFTTDSDENYHADVVEVLKNFARIETCVIADFRLVTFIG